MGQNWMRPYPGVATSVDVCRGHSNGSIDCHKRWCKPSRIGMSFGVNRSDKPGVLAINVLPSRHCHPILHDCRRERVAHDRDWIGLSSGEKGRIVEWGKNICNRLLFTPM